MNTNESSIIRENNKLLFQETLEESQDSGCGSGNDTQVIHLTSSSCSQVSINRNSFPAKRE